MYSMGVPADGACVDAEFGAQQGIHRCLQFTEKCMQRNRVEQVHLARWSDKPREQQRYLSDACAAVIDDIARLW